MEGCGEGVGGVGFVSEGGVFGDERVGAKEEKGCA